MGTAASAERTDLQNGPPPAEQVDNAIPRARPRAATTRPYQKIADNDRGTGGESLADFLGLFSLGLGLAESLMPGVMARVIGIDHESETNRKTLRLMGLREISSGVAILSRQQPKNAVWSRVAGDAIDLALLGKALANPRNSRGRTLFATANVLAVAALDVMCAQQLSEQPETVANEGADQGIIHTRRAITVNRPVNEVYDFWHDFENLPRFMRHLESVKVTSPGHSHWVAKAPGGQTIEWDAETTEDVPNERISWKSTQTSYGWNAGTVTFLEAPGNRGTEVRVDLQYHPPGGKIVSKVAEFWREEPGQQVQDDLRHFKQVMEIGEIMLSDANKQPGIKPHPGQPDNEPVRVS